MSHGLSRLQRVLLADGDMGVQATLAVTLYGKFFVVDACSVGEALHLVAQELPDLLIVSTRQPDLDAGSLVRALRAKTATCPVFLLSDPDHLESAGALLVLGVNGYFVKPLAFDRLLPQISALGEARQGPAAAFCHLSAHVGRAIQYLSCQSPRFPTVKELADVVGVSVSHLTHRFSFDTAMSPKEYLTRMRIECAKRLLARTSGKLSAIATQLGFSDAAHLSRVFRERTGQSPGRFRRV